MNLTGVTTQAAPLAVTQADAQLRKQARALEAGFLAEMLSYSGLGTASQAFGGGIGEEQFSSFLRAEQARLIVERGGIGLAEQVFRAMKGARNVG